MCFCFATKLFRWWLTSSFEDKKASVTNVHTNMFFTMCIKQRKERKRGGEGSWRTEARIQSNVGKIESMKAVWKVVILILNFLQLICSQGRKLVVSLKPYPQQILLERKHSEWFGMNGCITNFPASLLNIYVVTNDDTGEIF